MDIYEAVFNENRKLIWGLCYRMTGCAADADDVVQETFVRAIARPPGDLSQPWRPWLVRVAVNLSRDVLRRRRRSSYVGPWLPSPIATESEVVVPAYEAVGTGGSTEGRYDLLESVSMAFLTALEALTPQQRAVLLLRDVFDYSVRETAAALAASEGGVKVAHLRARRAMAAYECERAVPSGELRERTRRALWKFLEGLATADFAAVEALLCEDVRATSDGGGDFYAALNPIEGASNVARFYAGLLRKFGSVGSSSFAEYNGLPAVLVRVDAPRLARLAPCFLLQAQADASGRIRRLYTVLAPRKLTAVRF
ncbi:MAG: sigma-70 family RNA polymerase sigma factor [Deltaproteobacteria bacterium]|nr:sigma-70 family RNA polymerase sigma factor [Deltaproteobacteria bacterium]